MTYIMSDLSSDKPKHNAAESNLLPYSHIPKKEISKTYKGISQIPLFNSKTLNILSSHNKNAFLFMAVYSAL